MVGDEVGHDLTLPLGIVGGVGHQHGEVLPPRLPSIPARSSWWKGLPDRGTATPTVTVVPAASDRATGWWVKPRRSMTASTRCRVCSATGRVPLMTCETVLTETPASLATIVIVTGMSPILAQRGL
ncbi:hypothetical protein GCM10025883_32020 [Mobilicoccus caccae]|uniref:Uncharacterized protein n=1 Tax=Mobilicoccus caccae TaxID=1859295 RepID=A0ABQ6ITF7_9MICO|nr:hypothetical protein GCM10025883_32020 [Mobilicoccus caccae]